MLKCWTEAPDKRPPFVDLVPSFTSLLEEVAEYMDFALLSADEAQRGGYDHLEKGCGYDHLEKSTNGYDHLEVTSETI